jgi:hypothetical protein
MPEMKAYVVVVINYNSPTPNSTQHYFDNPCQARNFLSAITESLVTLVEQGAISTFSTELNVWGLEEKK